MNGREVRIMLMTCKGCEATARYNIHSSVAFVDASRALKAKCTCKEE
jgi:hypothetical protein|tara:strand:+ start:477 stop:617 length:141 start_codon:yes stop_codon:yes gene_type:complete